MAATKKKNKKKALNYEWQRILYFFKFHSPESNRAQLWQMLKLSLTSNDETIDEDARSNMIFFYESLNELVENIYSLLKKQR